MPNVCETITIALCIIISVWDNVCNSLICTFAPHVHIARHSSGVICVRFQRPLKREHTQVNIRFSLFPSYERWPSILFLFQTLFSYLAATSGYYLFPSMSQDVILNGSLPKSHLIYPKRTSGLQLYLCNATNLFPRIIAKLVVKMHKACWCDRWN